MITTKMRFILPIILMFIVPVSYGQGYSIDSLFIEFKRDIEIEQKENNGVVVMDDDTRLTYYLLMLNAPVDSLVKYTDDNNPAVRSQIFTGLIQKEVDSITINNIVEKHINDTSEFVIGGGVVVSWKVNKYMQFLKKHKEKNGAREINYAKRIEKLKKEPLGIIPDVDHGLIAKEDLLKMNNLVCTDKRFKIHSFELSTNTGKNAISDSNVVTADMKEIIVSSVSGEKVFFESIMAEGPDGTTRQLGTMMVKIK